MLRGIRYPLIGAALALGVLAAANQLADAGGTTAPGIVQSGTIVPGNCAQFSAQGVQIDAGTTCGTGTAGVIQSTGTANQIFVNGNTAAHTGATTYSLPNTVDLGTPSTASGIIELFGVTSGKITIQPQAAAGTYNFNLPTTAGASGLALTSAGGAAAPMTWSQFLTPANNLSDVADAPTARTNLGVPLGTSGATLGLLNSNVTFSGNDIHTGTVTLTGAVSGAGINAYLASPPAIGGTAAAGGSFTTLAASSTVSGAGFSAYLASPPAIGGTVAAAGTFTNLAITSAISGAGMVSYFASPSALGSTAPNSVAATTLSATGAITLSGLSPGTQVSCLGLNSSNVVVLNNAACGSGGGGGGGTVTSVGTTSPISGGTITTTGTISCPTCVVASSPGAGIAHFAGGTQTTTSSAVGLASADVTGTLPFGNGGTGATSLSAHGMVVVNSGGTALSTVAPGTSNNCAVSNGTDWVSTTCPAAGGGTLTVTDGTTSVPSVTTETFGSGFVVGGGAGSATVGMTTIDTTHITSGNVANLAGEDVFNGSGLTGTLATIGTGQTLFLENQGTGSLTVANNSQTVNGLPLSTTLHKFGFYGYTGIGSTTINAFGFPGYDTITTNALPKFSDGSGATTASSVSDNGTTVSITEPVLFTGGISGYKANVGTTTSTACTLTATGNAGCSGITNGLGDCGTFIKHTTNTQLVVTIPTGLAVGCQVAFEDGGTFGTNGVILNGSAVTAATLHSGHSYLGTFGQFSVIGITMDASGVAVLTGDGA